DGTVGFHLADYDTTRDLVIDPTLVYSTYYGGSLNEGINGNRFSTNEPNQMFVDPAGNAYVVGFTPSTNFPVSAGAFQTTYGGDENDGVLIKLDPTGNRVFATYLGGSNAANANGRDSINGVTVDAAGNIYVVGATNS